MTAEAEDVTPAAAASALGDGLRSALLVAGVDKWPKRDGWPLYPLFSDERVGGRRYRRAGTSRLRKGKAKLFAGADGITVVTASSEAVTVKFDDCEVLEQRPDGSRVLWGRDATRLQLDRRAWHEGLRLAAWIDEHIAADRRVPTNPAVEARVAELRQAVGTRLGRRRLLSQELEAASAFLDFAETPTEVLCASLGEERYALLLLTSRRLLFFKQGRLRAELPLHTVTSVQLRGSRRLRKQRLAVATDEGTLVFRHLFPNRRTTQFVEALQQALEGADAGDVTTDRPARREALPGYAALAAFPISLCMLVAEAPLDDGSPHTAHPLLLASAALMLACNGGACAVGAWLGRVGSRRAAEAGERGRAATYGILLSMLGLLFWVALAIAALLSEW